MFKRGDIWTLYIPRPNQRPVQRSTNTRNRALGLRMERMVHDLRDARRWDVLGMLATGTLAVSDAYDAYVMRKLDALVGREASPRIVALLDGWIASLDIREATAKNYRRQVERLFDDSTRVSALTPGYVRDAIASLGLSGGTRRTYFASLSSFCHYLVAHELLPVHPMAEKGMVPRPKRNPPRTRWETAQNDERLCLAAESPFREYFALVHATGAERAAALKMTRADIDLDRWEVHIPGTKTKTRDRYGVPVDVWARKILAPYVKKVLHGPLFDLTIYQVWYAHKAARKAVGLDGYQMRDARHSVAIRWLVVDEVPIWDVAERLGHGDATEALKTYTKTVLREAAKRLGVDHTSAQKEA